MSSLEKLFLMDDEGLMKLAEILASQEWAFGPAGLEKYLQENGLEKNCPIAIGTSGLRKHLRENGLLP